MGTLKVYSADDGATWTAVADVPVQVTHVLLYDAADDLPASRSVEDVEKWLERPDSEPILLKSPMTMGPGETLTIAAGSINLTTD